MRLVDPITITTEMVLSNNTVNLDADYDPMAYYELGDKCTYNGYIYVSLQNTNHGHTPGITDSVAWWSQVGPSNRNAMFDAFVSTTSKRDNSLTVVLQASHVDSLTLPYVSGSELVVTVTKDSTEIFSRTLDLRDSSSIKGWKSYFFSDRGYKHAVAITDLPPIPNVQISVTVNFPLNVAEIGMIQIGRYLDLGLEDYNLKREVIDYSQPTFDKFGELTITKQKYSKKYTTSIVIDNALFDLMTEKLDSLASKPIVCIGGNGYFQSLIVFGLISYSADIRTVTRTFISLEVKGLT